MGFILEEFSLNILFLGDIVGNDAVLFVCERLRKIKKENNVSFCIANGENSAKGKGITQDIANSLLNSGVDVITLGNHYNSKKDVNNLFDDKKNIIRPLNLIGNNGGEGSILYDMGKVKIGVINLLGKVFMDEVDCPFKTAENEVEKLKEDTNILIVDFHAEATSEKMAMGYYLDGKVTAVIGTHTHIQTADEKVLPNGTGYITDAGMTGPVNSVLGMDVDVSLKRLLENPKEQFVIAKGKISIQGVLLSVDEKSGKTENICRINID